MIKFDHFGSNLALKYPRNPLPNHFPGFSYSTRGSEKLDQNFSKRNQNFKKQKNLRHEPSLKTPNLQYLFVTPKIDYARDVESRGFDSPPGVGII